MKKIERYLPVLKKDRKGKYRASVHKDPYGKYVKFEEHAKRMASLQNELSTQETLRRRIRDLEEENERLRSICSSHEGNAYGLYHF